MNYFRSLTGVYLVFGLSGFAWTPATLCAAGDESPATRVLRSGLQPGQRPGPYAAVIATGPQRGQSYCYVCETENKPGVIVFARSLSEPLGKLVRRLDQALAEQSKSGLRAWVTFLSADQPGLDPLLVRWAQDHAIHSVPLGVYEDPAGPPSYRLAREADVTVLVFVNRQVTANFAFRAGELNETRIAEISKAISRITSGLSSAFPAPGGARKSGDPSVK